MSDKQEALKILQDAWQSPIVLRRDVEHASAGCISRRYLENLDSAGKGPPMRYFNGKCGYLKEDFFSWLEERIK